MKSTRIALGKQGEQIAAAYLERQGYTLVEANWHAPQGEFDLIMRQNEVMVFVEVRTRRAGTEAAFESISPRKKRILEQLCYLYLTEKQLDSDWRIDMVAVAIAPNGQPIIEHIEDALTGNSQPLIVILGPTAVGKTDLSIQMAQAFGGEIVNADSRQIYREMDIGTAKPTLEQRQQAVHHLIDLVAPDEDLSLAQYQRFAYAAIDKLHTDHRLPLLVGGTGQYITALLEGWSIPEVPPNPDLRAELAAQDVETLYTRLLELDPEAEQFVDPRNMRRIIRALEVCIETGRPFSEQRSKTPPPYQVLVYGLTMERERLYQRADQRVHEMMAQGFLEEVRRLLAKGYSRNLPSMSGLGYRELAAHLIDGTPLDKAVEATQLATHNFIRRQYTWFRGHNHQIMWHNVEEIASDALITEAAYWLETQRS